MVLIARESNSSLSGSSSWKSLTAASNIDFAEAARPGFFAMNGLSILGLDGSAYCLKLNRRLCSTSAVIIGSEIGSGRLNSFLFKRALVLIESPHLFVFDSLVEVNCIALCYRRIV